MDDITVLITNCGGPGIGGIIDSLRLQKERGIKIVGVDCNSNAAGKYLVDSFYLVPMIKTTGYRDYLLTLCDKEDVDVLLCLSSSELDKLNYCRVSLAGLGVKTARMNYHIGSTTLLDITLDKAKCYEHFKGISPRYRSPQTDSVFWEDAKWLGYPKEKICLKPRQSSGSRGFLVLTNKMTLNDLLSVKHCNIRALGNLVHLWRFHDADYNEVILMEYLPGIEYSIDILADNGDMLYCVPRVREVVKDGVTTVGRVDLKEEIIDMCGMITKDLQYTGNLNIQLKHDRDDKPKLIEINPRLSGTVALCTAAGANLVYWGVKQILGEPIPKVEVKDGVRMVRYLKEVFIDETGHWEY